MNGFREVWAEYIRNHPSVGRLMSARGDVRLQATSTVEPAAIQEFLNKLKISEYDRRLLYSLRFLARPDLQHFCVTEVSKLLKSLAKTLLPETAKVRGAIKGRIAWARTYQMRAGSRIDESSYAVTVRRRSLDVPENRLLKLFLTTLSALLHYVLDKTKSGELGGSLKLFKGEVDLMLRRTSLRQIQSSRASTVVMRNRARRAKDWRYGKIADFQSEYESVFLEPKWIAILNLLHKNWLEPIADDDLFELYTLFVVFDVISFDLGFGVVEELGMVRPGRREVGYFHRRSDGVRAKVFFDQTPQKIFHTESEYVALSSKYHALSFDPRRPDITISFVLPSGSERRLLIECKATREQNYQRESVYKCFGYLRDFKQLWTLPEQNPKVILVFPEELLAVSDLSASDELVLASVQDRVRLKLAIAHCISQ